MDRTDIERFYIVYLSTLDTYTLVESLMGYWFTLKRYSVVFRELNYVHCREQMYLALYDRLKNENSDIQQQSFPFLRMGDHGFILVLMTFLLYLKQLHIH